MQNSVTFFQLQSWNTPILKQTQTKVNKVYTSNFLVKTNSAVYTRGPQGGRSRGPQSVRASKDYWFWPLSPNPPRGPPILPSPIVLPNNGSYRQNSTLHFCLLFFFTVFLVDVFRLKIWREKNYTILLSIHYFPLDPCTNSQV